MMEIRYIKVRDTVIDRFYFSEKEFTNSIKNGQEDDGEPATYFKVTRVIPLITTTIKVDLLEQN